MVEIGKRILVGGIVMNENLDLTKILEGCPVGTEFYHAGYGRVWLAHIYPDVENVAYPIVLSLNEKSPRLHSICVTARGTISYSYDGECLLVPSKDQRDWSKFVRFWDKKPLDEPVVEKFDPKTFEPFDKVLVRVNNTSIWEPNFFGYKDDSYDDCVVCISDRLLVESWEQCIPYNKETKHLVGTTDDCPEYYKWWN